MRFSTAMTSEVARQLAGHLLRRDGQEDLCFAAWTPSTGLRRQTAIIRRPILPVAGDRHVHGNASYEAQYAVRAAQEAAASGAGLAFMHSHPGGQGWQILNDVDRMAEARLANLAREVTGLPLVGLTLAGSRAWSSRMWGGVGREVTPTPGESVRVIGDSLDVTFNDVLLPAPASPSTQVRTTHTWGKHTQAEIARLRIAVAGIGSVGMAIAEVLARTGVQGIGVFDFDTVELVNLDRLRGAGLLDALLRRPKTYIAERLLTEGSTAVHTQHEFHELSICEPEGLARLLDFDLVFSCVDRPWPRHVLNAMAYADLIPVIEGGLSVFQNTDGTLRNAYWRSQVIRPGRPCLLCLRQYDPALVQVERDGSLDDPSYIANLPPGSTVRRRENVAALSTSVSAALLEQFVSYVTRPSGFGDPGPLRFSLRDHTVDKDLTLCDEECAYQSTAGCGDARLDPTSRHHSAENARYTRTAVGRGTRVFRRFDDLLWRSQLSLTRLAKSHWERLNP